MTDWLNQCHFGDVRDVLQRMIAAGVKVNTIVTSPPYWGLRSYLPADHPDKAREIGSEPTLREFLDTMVGVFDLCREVLADDGTMFVNMGDSYFSGSQRANSCGTSGKAPKDSQGHDCLCGNLCDVCRKAYRIGKSHSDGLRAPMLASSLSASIPERMGSVPDHLPTSDCPPLVAHTSAATPDLPPVFEPVAAAHPAALGSTNLESSLQLVDSCLQESPRVAECQLCGDSLPDCVQVSAHKGECSFCTASRESEIGTEGRGVLGSAYPYSTSASLKAKDLIGQPWRLAFALQDAGWWLRQDIIWHKPNPMPESIKDRCTKAHEYIFLLSKSERYYFDQGAIRTPLSAETKAQSFESMDFKARDRYKMPDGWNTGDGAHGSFHPEGREKGAPAHGSVEARKIRASQDHKSAPTAERNGIRGSKRNSFARESKNTAGEHGQKPQHRPERDEVHYANSANKRSVWTVATEAYPGSHFATFPRALIEPCILAGAPAGGIVLDIFMGSGTTAQVAEKLGRQWIGIDIDVRNKALQDERLRQPSLDLVAA